MTTNALELRGISRRFGPVQALDDVTFAAQRGRIHALLGENGAGKTTLMHVAFGLTQPDSGSIHIASSVAPSLTPARAIEAGIGMVRQHPMIAHALTVLENAELGNRGRYRPRHHAENLRRLAAELGMTLEPEARAGDLSVPDQQRLEILKAVGRGARILMLDEPTAVLSPSDSAALMAWLRAFASDGGTVVFITHRISEALEYADDITVLRSGRVVLRAAAGDASRDAIASAMLGTSAGLPTVDASPVSAEALTQHAEVGLVARLRGVTIGQGRGTTQPRPFDLDLLAGEVLGIAGVEGSGHRELLLLLAGRRRSSAGTVELPERIGFVPEDRHHDAAVLAFSLTENVAIANAGHRRGRLDWNGLRAKTVELISTHGIRARSPSASLGTLSGGNQQKLVLARELDRQNGLVVLENPARGLDVQAASGVRERIRRARGYGQAVVVYSSDLDEVVEVADRVIVVRDCEVVSVGRDRRAIGRAMIGES